MLAHASSVSLPRPHRAVVRYRFGAGRVVFACEDTRHDWSRVHERIVQLAADRAAGERELCQLLLEAERLALHQRVGYASLAEYADRTLGLSARQTEERLRAGRELERLPLLESALASGKLCWSAVRELTRVAEPETEKAWCEWAADKRVRQVERAVTARQRGDLPQDRPDPSRIQHTLRFEVRAETMALFRDLQAAILSELGAKRGEVDDDALLNEIARRALGGPADEGRASYQVAISRCDDCKLSRIDAGGVSHVVDDATAEMMVCDAQHIGEVGAPPREGAEPPKRAKQTVPPATRRKVLRRDGKRCVVPGCRNHRFVDVHHIDPKNEGGGHDPERLCVLCGFHHRRMHDGTLSIDGTASAGFVFVHAGGTPYGQPFVPAAIEVTKQAFAALRKMGFKQTDARARVDAVVRAGAPSELADFIRAALRSK